jgi:PTS system N-acetylgalactosamine-specific IIA component
MSQAPDASASLHTASNVTPPPRAIVAGHGQFPDGMVSAVGQITGLGHLLLPFSNVGLGREEIEAGLRERLTRHGISVVFTDLPGGSATLAVRRVMRDFPGMTLVTGTNLATLIDFVFHDDSLTPAQAAHRAADKGRAALAVSTTVGTT